MKKAIVAVLLSLFVCNVAFSGSEGKGEVKLRSNIVDYFIKYIKTPGKNPFVFILSDDGSWASYYYCRQGTGACQDRGGIQQGIKKCESKTNTKCGLFARRRTVIWKNGINKGGKQGAIKSKWSDTQIKAKLTELGFLGYTTKTTTSSVKSEKQKMDEKKAEEKRLKAAKKAEKEKLRKQRIAEEKRLRAEKKAEKEKLRKEKNAEKKRLKEEKQAAAKATREKAKEAKDKAKTSKDKAKADSKETSIAKQLREVNELYQAGALTEEEFKEAKEQIINQ